MRWPLVLLITALLVGGVAYDRVEHVDATPEAVPFRPVVTPALVEPAPLSSVWYCPVGSAGGGYAEHTVGVVNAGTDPAVATVAVLTDEGPGPSIRLDVAPGSRREVALAELETADAAGAVVEVVSGQGVVDHVVATPHGPVRGACATEAADQWHFAGGVTTRDASYRLALLNPFPEDAVFDVRFEATGRARTPSDLQGAIVPARSVRVIEVADHVAREGAVATTVTLRRGRVVAERLQSFDGVLGPEGAALQLGAPSPALASWFPAGRVHEGGDQRLVLYNPGDAVAEVDVELQPHDPELTAAYGLVPLEVSVAPGRFEVLDLVATASQLQVPLPLEVGLHVQSVNGVPVVGERWSLAPPLDTDAIGADPGAAGDGSEAEADAGSPAEPPAGGVPAEPPAGEVPGTEAAEGGAAPADGAATTPDGTPAPPEGAGPAPATAEGALPGAGAAAAAVRPVALAAVPQAPEDDGELHDDVPAEEVAPPPAPTQATPTAGVVIDRGAVTGASGWALPGTPLVPGGGTVLVVVAIDEAVTVEVQSLTGVSGANAQQVEVAAGQRSLVPLTGGGAVADLLVTGTGPIVASVNVVDGAGALAVLNGVPILERETR